MKNRLNQEEKLTLDKRIADTERRTHTQIVFAVVERSDSYAELPWKAFALGASLAGILALAMNISSPLDSPTKAALLAIVMMLSAGAGLALLTVLLPNFAKLFLHRHRVEVETRQYAESLFLSKELFTSPERRSLLVMISLFERHIVLLPDAGIAKQINAQAADEIIRHMSPSLQTGRLSDALENGLQKIESFITDRPSTSSGLEFPNIIEEKGA